MALESTGGLCWPGFNLLEEAGLAVVLVHPQHVKAVPGRKTDVADSTWLADLLRQGLLRASFIPPAASRALRELTRYRKALVQERTQEANRLQKGLETANLKLAGVATDILGGSGRHMLLALAAGETDPTLLADLARGQLRKKLATLEQALSGRVKAHHRVLIRAILRHMDALEQSIEELDREVEQLLAPFEQEFQVLPGIPGVNRTAAATSIAERGVQMERFPSGKHVASWAGVCPGSTHSGGKRLSSQTRQGTPWLRALLGEVAWAAIRQKNPSFGARFRRLARRQNKQQAMVAVMHHRLLVIYHVLRKHEPYQEVGPDYFQPTDPQRLVHRHRRQLDPLGYQVTLVPKGAA